MNEKVRFFLVGVFCMCCFADVGCSGLLTAVKETNSQQVQDMLAKTAPLASALPTGYAVLGGSLLAVLGAIAKNWWSDKHKKV